MRSQSEFDGTVDAIYMQWIDGLRDISLISDPAAKADQLLFLSDIYSQAQELIKLSNFKHSQAHNKLRLILSRPIKDSIISVKKYSTVVK